jgi:uncharacterized protein YjbI with pentapeptide repeats
MLDVSNRDFREADFQGSRFINVRGSTIVETNGSRTIIAKSDFTGAKLMGCQFVGAAFQGCQFQGANLSLANLQGTKLWNAEMDAADLDMVQFENADLSDANLRGADLGGSNLQGGLFLSAHLEGANLNDDSLQEADFYDADLDGAVLVRANLQGASLNCASLKGADLFQADLQGADLGGSVLTYANLDHASLYGVEAGQDGNPRSNANDAISVGVNISDPPSARDIKSWTKTRTRSRGWIGRMQSLLTGHWNSKELLRFLKPSISWSSIILPGGRKRIDRLQSELLQLAASDPWIASGLLDEVGLSLHWRKSQSFPVYVNDRLGDALVHSIKTGKIKLAKPAPDWFTQMPAGTTLDQFAQHYAG